jgi:hypothetical protein
MAFPRGGWGDVAGIGVPMSALLNVTRITNFCNIPLVFPGGSE